MRRFLKPALLVIAILSVVIFFVGRQAEKASIGRTTKVESYKVDFNAPETPAKLSSLGYIESKLATPTTPPETTRKIIQTGQVTLSVKHYDSFYKALQKEVQQTGGYVSNLEANRDSGTVTLARIVIRIPPARTNLMVSWLREQGEIQSENIKAEDVSEEYYDIHARLENSKRLESRLIDMVKTNTGKLEDLILLEEKLGEIREKIEQMEGRIRNMDRLISLATLSLNVQVQSSTTITAPTFSSRAASAWKDSVIALKEVSQGLLLALITIVPWVVPLCLAAVILMFVFKVIRRIFRRRVSVNA